MTQTSAFHFESLVWDWPIAIYLFLIGISAGLVTLAVLLHSSTACSPSRARISRSSRRRIVSKRR